MTLKSDSMFEFIAEKVKQDPKRAKSVGGIFLFNITQDGKQMKQWTMDLKSAQIYEGPPQNDTKPNTTLTVSDDVFIDLATGILNPQTAFLKGKLKLAGNVMLAQKLGPLLKTIDNKL